METLLGTDWPTLVGFAVLVTFAAGVVKGVVGFAMPMLMISGLSSVMPPDIALAGLILPTLVTNLWQGFRHGPGAAFQSMRRFRVFLLTGVGFMVIGAQLVPVMSASFMLLLLGIPVSLFGLSSLMGYAPRLPTQPGLKAEASVGAVTGFLGGISGIWGPTTVAMLTALQTEKREQIRAQGVIFGMGSIVLALSHLGSGVLNPHSALLSAMLIPPALIGLGLGFVIQDRIDQAMFRKLTLLVLVVSGLNLVRRGLVVL
ncbi:MAG: sulfite exporter TauE/SafE family protein [Pseudomonadota bacterium]